MEGLKLAAAKLVVYLHPSKAKNVADAIHGEISSLLFKFNETFDGVLLAYDTDFPSNLAKILPGVHPYFGVRLETKLLLFHPKPDMVLEGEKPGKEVFRSTIHKKHRIKIGTIIRFVVKSFDEEILHVSGSLLPAHTGCVKWLERHLEEWSQSDSTIKKRRANEQTGEISEPDKAANDGKTFAVNTESHNKKSKRRKSNTSIF
ncbi:uncharacterized protein LOC113748609 isoform X4 [Coffea eugenioides]|uniref:uncharacterized protein LOC113748609 isoform X4 n=1 Tax=Coffea eugenioides TaxID=49369 RepID=UPI000F605EED|nr:uncharacterized protein LOC113748609 isoform X4 [Coffea eugenioides]